MAEDSTQYPHEAGHSGTSKSSGMMGKIGVALTRGIVPLWILAGVTFKIIEHTPRSLPETVREINSSTLNLSPHMWLSALIGLELLSISVMFFSRRFARLMAIFMLSCFCLILFSEMYKGNFLSCGCFGKLPVPPWLTLTVDALLLLGVVFCAPRYPGKGWPAVTQIAAASLASVLGFVVSFALVLPHGKEVSPSPIGPNTPDQGTGQTTPPPLTGIYYIKDAASWVGQNWSNVDLFQYITDWPEGMDSGRRYVIFYLRSCDHCQTLLETHFDAEPPAPTVVVAMPESTEGFDTANALMMFYCEDCVEHRELPVGPDWLLTGPIVVALEDGVIRCVKEGDDAEDPECLIWH